MREKIKKSIQQMFGMVVEMIDLVNRGLMENDVHYLNSALNKEHIIDDLEKDITANIVGISKDLNKRAHREFILLGEIAENTERMGDELRCLIERIEIKIAEKLFFSDIGIQQYKEVFEKMQESVRLVGEFLNEDNVKALDAVLKNGEDIKKLIERYRIEHLERLTKGICEVRAANMYFDMLDFTGNIARHCTNIARGYKET